MTQFVDYIGQPIAVGDTVAVPMSRGVLQRFEIAALIPLVPHRDGSKNLMRLDHDSKARPTAFVRDMNRPETHYVCQVWRSTYRSERKRWPVLEPGHLVKVQ